MEPEVYFLRYALPCSHILMNVRKEISDNDFKLMEDAALNNKKVDRAFLEKVFFRAFERIEKVASDLGKDKWDIEVIREYFCVRHNPVLDKSDYPESFKEQCKVYEGEVTSIGEDGEVIVEYGGEGGGGKGIKDEVDGEKKEKKKRKVKKDFVPDIKLGDKVRIHWSYVVERI